MAIGRDVRRGVILEFGGALTVARDLQIRHKRLQEAKAQTIYAESIGDESSVGRPRVEPSGASRSIEQRLEDIERQYERLDARVTEDCKASARTPANTPTT